MERPASRPLDAVAARLVTRLTLPGWRLRSGRRDHHLLAHPQHQLGLRGRLIALLICFTVLGGVLVGEVATPQNVTFGGFTLLVVIAATWLLPLRLYTPVLIAALAVPAAAVRLGGVDDLTAKFQFSSTVVAAVLAMLTVRAVKAAEAERQRSHESLLRLTADAAHELRSPLTLIRATLDHLVRQRRGVEEYERRTRTVLLEVERLIRLSNSLLALAQSDAGVLAVSPERIAMNELVDEARSRWAERAAEEGVALTTLCPADLAVDCDPVMVGRVLDNLIENALKHTTREGTVTVSAATEGNQVTVLVADTGSGIPPALRDKLFDRFARDEAGSRGGTGLGLALCAAIAAAHRGRMELLASDATGTRIALHLPVTAPSAPGKPAAAA